MIIKICIPVYNRLHKQLFDYLESLQDTESIQFYRTESGKAYHVMKGTSIHFAREYLISQSEDIDPVLEIVDAYWLLDSDIVPQSDTLQRLIDCNLDIVSMAYLSRWEAGVYEAGYFKKDHPGGVVGKRLAKNARGIVQVDYSGNGCMLIKRKIFEEIKRPYFPPVQIRHKGKVSIAGDDIGFAIVCRRNDIPIYVSCDCPVKHLAQEVEMPEQKPVSPQQMVNILIKQANGLLTNLINVSDFVTSLLAENAQLKAEIAELKPVVEEVKE